MKAAVIKITILAAAILFPPEPVIGQSFAEEGRAAQQASPQNVGEIPLSQQLEGLQPLPRLAYLHHLMKQGRADADVMFQTAVAFHELGRIDSALHYYDRVIAIDPNNFKSHVNKGVLYDDEGDYASAIKSFATAATLNPDDVLAHSHLAFLLHQNGDHRAAWDHLHSALVIDPAHPQPHFYLAVFFWEAKIFREAMREWETVMDLEPDGFLAVKARDNIVMLQKALESPSPEGDWHPER
ncbi:MAG: tetratricopeptide repeat protein [Candidatus Krumholzibacteria bacterium]|nr:tetratricopeptide repeat protein [Candidatus Krumholzibacteria bacterium]